MAAKTLGLTISATVCVSKIAAYYCDSDRCSEDEYCCGDNLCCTSYKVWGLWYFWFGLVFFLILLSMCTCLWRFRHPGTVIINKYNYSPLRQDGNTLHCRNNSDQEYIGPGGTFFASATHPPPPYSNYSPVKSAPPSSLDPPSYVEVVSGPGVPGHKTYRNN
ncbi:vesicular, overexpressed in cancer, prosurvival protein 1-like [Haliotis rufescens]|uniref:vesicular, overexpressed in cancer, prosurvival protein 1-like n=1 Tax=Haliotis rufescens TaxID=6454 RepID=UPI001EB0AC3D|nr:vesicular, overexpressed in cancer, prosurvival protein 1-like [Haliotis rufescens]